MGYIHRYVAVLNCLYTHKLRFSVALSFACVSLIFIHYNLKRNIQSSSVEIVGIDQRSSQLNRTAYVFVIPKARGDIGTTCDYEGTLCNGVPLLQRMLDEFSDIDGATCHGVKGITEENHIKKLKTCSFHIRDYTMIINSTGSAYWRKISDVRSESENISICKIVDGPFLIRRDVFNRFGLRPSHGEVTLMDFFLRSNGNLRIVATPECTFSEQQLFSDRGAMRNKEIYLDYGLVGFHHNILRIVRDDTITWTKCAKSLTSCPDIPLQELNETKRKLFPYCCNALLDRYLVDTTDAFNQIGMDYRVCFGTLLGAVRTKTIIPWTTDIDLCLRFADYRNFRASLKLEKILKAKRYSTPMVFNLRRVIPQYPFTTKISSLVKLNLFDSEIFQMMEDMLPIKKPDWGTQGYVDLYPFEEFIESKSNIVINGRSYRTVSQPYSHLLKEFGKTYNSTAIEHRRIRSKDPHKLFLFWKWNASMTQEDTVTKSYLVWYIVLSVVMLLILYRMLKLCMRYRNQFCNRIIKCRR